jgi:hypothetical protein
MAKDNELNNLVKLFDDPDEVVAQAVNRRMLKRGESVLYDLLAMENEMPDRRDSIERKFYYLNTEFRISEFETYLASGQEDLTEGFSILTSLFNPGWSKQCFYDKITQLSIDFLCELKPGVKTALENVRIFNHIFYNRLHFGVADSFSPGESLTRLDLVIESRKGNPVSVSILYFLLARVAGLNVYPLCFPGGLIPVYQESGANQFYINIFKEGEIFGEDKLKYFLKHQGFDLSFDEFSVREDNILMTIYLESMMIMYDNLGNEADASTAERALKMTGEERFLTSDGDDMDDEDD